MYLMWLLKKTITNERSVIVTYLLNTFLLILIFNLSLDTNMILYPFTISLFILCLYLISRMALFHRYLELLKASKQSLTTHHFLDFKDEYTFSTINDIHRKYRFNINELQQNIDQRNILFSQFIHNMKTSVAVIELASSNNKLSAMNDIIFENEKQKSHLEQLLNILRFNNFSNDYVPEEVDLLDLVYSVINDNKREFIYNQIKPIVTGHPNKIYTDEKWCRYIIKQLISNAIKYSPKHTTINFTIDTTPNVTYLHIRDEGIGIDTEDIHRIFDLFYTGKNGRLHPNATGIGLYMVKMIANRLNHTLSITSEVNQGTCVTIGFPYNFVR